MTAIHFGTEAISRIEGLSRHIKEIGPHNARNCPQCVKLITLAHEHAQRMDDHIVDVIGAFVGCRRDGCTRWFIPVKPSQVYCSHACRQAAYKARRAGGE